jgi:hypothetical protein
MKKKPLFSGCGLLVIISLLGSAFFGWAMFGENEVYVSGASSHRLAPPAAREINYYERRNISGVVSITYVVGEREFRNFAESQGWTLERQAQGPSGVIASSPEAWANGTMNHHDSKIGECLFYEMRHANGGGIAVIYDLAASRATINQASR